MEEGKAAEIENPPTPLLGTQEIVQNEKEEKEEEGVKDEIKENKEDKNEDNGAKESRNDGNTLDANAPSQGTDIAISVTPSLTPLAEGKPANKKKASQKEKQLLKQKETRKIRESNVKLPTATIKEVTIDDILELKISRKKEQQSLLNMGFSRSQSSESAEESTTTKYKSFPMFKSDQKATVELAKDAEDESILADDYLDKIVSKNKEKHSNEERGSVANKSYDPLQERIKRWDQEKEEIEALATRYTSGAKRKQEFMENDGLSAKILDENSDSMVHQEDSGEVIIDTEAADNGHETDDMDRSSSVQELDRLLPQESQKEEEEFMLKCRRRMKQNKVLGPSDLFTGSSSLLGSISRSQDMLSSSSLLSYESISAKRSSSTSINEYHDHNTNSEIISNDSRSSSLLMARNSLRKSSTIKSMDSASKVKKALFSTVMQSSTSFNTSPSKTVSQTKSTAKKPSTSEPPKKVQKKAVQKQLSFFK